MTCLNGRYRLRQQVGHGGMAVVWRADDLLLQRPVAVKMLNADLGGDPLVRHRIREEALAAAGLSHPNITNVYDYGEHWDAADTLRPYLVMEFVEGRTLAACLADSATLTWARTARIGAAVADALARAHAHGIVHRDIKPGNVVLGATGVKVVDFGVAAGIGQDTVDARGVVWGTRAYLPPEATVTTVAVPAGDVYALGLMLVRCLTGRLPHRAPAKPVDLDPILRQELAEVPPAFRDLLRRCLSTDPSARPDAGTVARTLDAIAASAPAEAVTAPRRAAPPTAPLPTTAVAGEGRRRLRRPAALAAAALAVSTAIVAAQAADIGRRADADNDTADGQAVQCAADYGLSWKTDGTFVAELSVTNTGQRRMRDWSVRFQLPPGQRITNAAGVQWTQERRTVTLSAQKWLWPGSGVTAVLRGNADAAEPAAPRRFALNDVFCGRVSSRTRPGDTTARQTGTPAAGAVPRPRQRLDRDAAAPPAPRSTADSAKPAVKATASPPLPTSPGPREVTPATTSPAPPSADSTPQSTEASPAASPTTSTAPTSPGEAGGTPIEPPTSTSEPEATHTPTPTESVAAGAPMVAGTHQSSAT